MSASQLFALFLAIPSGLVAAGALWLCQRMGWQSDGPGLLCPMIIGAGAGLVCFVCLKVALFEGGPPRA